MIAPSSGVNPSFLLKYLAQCAVWYRSDFHTLRRLRKDKRFDNELRVRLESTIISGKSRFLQKFIQFSLLLYFFKDNIERFLDIAYSLLFRFSAG